MIKIILIKKIIAGVTIFGLGFVYWWFFYKNTGKPSCCDEDERIDADRDIGNNSDIKSVVYDRYSATARNFEANQQESADQIAEKFGYTQEDLNKFGGAANMGLQCGNPVAQASIKEGEVVMDLGSGGGFDSFLALQKVGASGKVIGIDMSKDMIHRAMNNAKSRGFKVGSINDVYDENKDVNITFYQSEIESMKLVRDNSINCIISNCVLNLIPNKLNAFKEIYRVLKSGEGRLAISDIALKKELPNTLNTNISAYLAGYVNCISGAVLRDKFEKLLREAGFKDIKFVLKNVDLNFWKSSWESGGATGGCCGTKEKSGGGCCATDKSNGCCSESNNNNNNNDIEPKTGIDFTEDQKNNIKKLLKDIDLNEYIGSYYVFAIK